MFSLDLRDFYPVGKYRKFSPNFTFGSKFICKAILKRADLVRILKKIDFFLHFLKVEYFKSIF